MQDSDDKDKLDQLSYRIKDMERKPPAKSEPASGSRMGFDFVGSIAVCGIVGALADRAFQTGPWCLLVMIFAGFAIGIMSMWFTLKKIDEKK